MKRLVEPKDDMPEAYKQIVKEESKPVPKHVVSNSDGIKDIPPSSVYNYNLKKMTSFKEIRRKYKMSNQLKMFVHDLKTVLDEYKPEQHELDDELLRHVLNISEQFFIYGSKDERNKMKQEAVHVLMMQYFRNDEALLNKFIGQVWPKVKKSNIFKRTYARFRLFLKV